MLTLKLKYRCNDENLYSSLEHTRRNYSSWMRYCYNRISDNKGNITDLELRNMYKTSVNHIELNSWLVQCGIKDARQNYNSFVKKSKEHEDEREYKIKKIEKKLERKKITQQTFKKLKSKAESKLTLIFGGKQNFYDRNDNKISREAFLKNRLLPLYYIGEKLHKGNRCFDFNFDFTITYKPSRFEHYILNLSYGSNQKKTLERIINLTNECKLTVSVKIDTDYIYISYDESELEDIKLKPIKNRVLGIDMNPNYIGVVIVDWKSSSDYKVIDHTIYNIKHFSDLYHELNKLNDVPSDDPRRINLSNKKTYETIKIAQHIFSMFKHYRCDILSIENLKIKQKDKDKGKNYNALYNNHWLRTTFVSQIRKLCNLNHSTLVEVKPEFSSFIGNIIFRDEDLPDMCLAAIEISRRGYEYYNQHITKTKQIKKNIINPDINDFKRQLEKSLEEFDLLFDGINLSEIYYSIKTEKDHPKLKGDPNKVRFHFEDVKHQIVVRRFFSTHSMTLLMK